MKDMNKVVKRGRTKNVVGVVALSGDAAIFAAPTKLKVGKTK